MAEIKLDYVNTFYDARGKLRDQFRRKGHKRVTIKGRPGSPEFMDIYHALLEKTGGAMPVDDIGASRTKAGTIDALIVNYKKHDVFTKALSKATQDMRRPILDHFREFKTKSGRRYGDNRLASMQEKDIRAALEGRKTRCAAKLDQGHSRPDRVRQDARRVFGRCQRRHQADARPQEHGTHDMEAAADRKISRASQGWHDGTVCIGIDA
jgi:hypothetical protein